MQKKKKKTKLFIFLIICFVLVPFLLTKGCNYTESLNQAKNSVSEPITSISEQIQPSASVYTHAHTHARTHSRSHYVVVNAHERAHNAQVHSIRKAYLTGTAVPISGYIDSIYVNRNVEEYLISLSEEELISLIMTLSEMINSSTNSYTIAGGVRTNGTAVVFGLKPAGSEGREGFTISFFEDNDETILQEIYINSDLSYDIITHNNKIVFGADTLCGENDYTWCGKSNDVIKNIVSITPFEQSSNNELSIRNLFTQLGNAMIIFGGAVVNVFIGMEPIFWNEGPTLIFILLIAAVSFALVFWGIELLISLIGVFKTKRKKKK